MYVCMYIRPCVRTYVCTYVQNVCMDKIHVQTSKAISSHQKQKNCTKMCPKKIGLRV
jgi:hypothetical protein